MCAIAAVMNGREIRLAGAAEYGLPLLAVPTSSNVTMRVRCCVTSTIYLGLYSQKVYSVKAALWRLTQEIIMAMHHLVPNPTKRKSLRQDKAPSARTDLKPKKQSALRDASDHQQREPDAAASITVASLGNV